MNEVTLSALREELIAIDDEIVSLNAQIRQLRWRHTPEGDRRRIAASIEENSRRAPSDGSDLGSGSHPALEGGSDHSVSVGRTVLQDRRLPVSEQIARLREDLSTALQRYMTVQTLLRARENEPD